MLAWCLLSLLLQSRAPPEAAVAARAPTWFSQRTPAPGGAAGAGALRVTPRGNRTAFNAPPPLPLVPLAPPPQPPQPQPVPLPCALCVTEGEPAACSDCAAPQLARYGALLRERRAVATLLHDGGYATCAA